MMRNALTVDVEDYFHVAAFSQQIDPATWDRFPLRVEYNTQRLLDLFAERECSRDILRAGLGSRALSQLGTGDCG